MNWNDHYNYHFPTEIFFGPGVIKNLGEHLKKRDFKYPLIVSDEGLSKLPLFSKVFKSLEDEGLNLLAAMRFIKTYQNRCSFWC